MFNGFIQPIDLKKELVFNESSPKAVVDKQLKLECKILPYDEKKSGEEIFKCPLCDLSNIDGRKALTEHLHHHQVKYKPCDGKHLCCLCGKELSSNSSLERHLLTHSNHRPFDCQICGKKFTTNGNLSRHVKASHSTESDKEQAAVTQKLSPSSSPSINPLFSIIKPESLSNTEAVFRWPLQSSNHDFLKILENSLKVYQKTLFCDTSDSIVNLSIKADSMISPNRWNSSNSFYGDPIKEELAVSSFCCKRVAKKISQKYRDRRYNSNQTGHSQLLMSDEIPLDLSMHRSVSPLTIGEHNSFLSESSEPIIITPTKTDFRNNFSHKKNSYKDAPKLIRCPMLGCSQKFPWNSSLMRHILTHTAHKPFRCIRCSKCFSTKSNRERHMHRVHGIKVNRLMIKTALSPRVKEENELMLPMEKDRFLSQREWMEMTSSDRKAEDISHTLLKEAGEPVIEPNPYRQHLLIKTCLRIS